MAASPSPASRSPLRMAGIALLGVGVIAAFAGLISTTQGDGNGTVAQAPTSSAQVLDPTAEAAPASPAPDAAATAPFVPGSTCVFVSHVVPEQNSADVYGPPVAPPLTE